MNNMALRPLWRAICFCLIVGTGLSACAQSTKDDDPIVHVIGQKMMLDMRYFCAESILSEQCKTPVTALNKTFADIIRKGHIGGVILFADNLLSVPQIVRLNYDLQQLAKSNGLPPLFIAIDQEGGRVARFDDAIATRFVGNMAIGATQNIHGTYYATAVNEGIANALIPLGFNVNFAPTVDVNVNPDNPVINVRSYGESAKQVAELGRAAVSALQNQGVISAMKHFPGHGDTHVDSHTGLPLVEHDITTVEQVDLLPFAQAINSDDPPAMIMTAHIQYPELDSTTFRAIDGSQTIVPATLSRAILTDLLRDQMHYEGIIVTDALDMAGIAHYVDEADAVIKTFQAGADIALMPYSIRTPKDVKGFWQMQKRVVAAAQNGTIDSGELAASAVRIEQAKARFALSDFISEEVKQRQENASALLPIAANKKLEAQLASDALTEVLNKDNTLPLSADGSWQVVMPDQARCDAFTQSANQWAKNVAVNCLSLATLPTSANYDPLLNADVLIVGDISPQHSLAEMGGMDDLAGFTRANKPSQYQWINGLFTQAKSTSIKRVFVALRAPYVIDQFAPLVDAAVVTYGYNVAITDGVGAGVVFDALVKGLTGQQPMPGSLPVTLQTTGSVVTP